MDNELDELGIVPYQGNWLGFADWLVREVNLSKFAADQAYERGKQIRDQYRRRAEKLKEYYSKDVEVCVTEMVKAQPGTSQSVNLLFGRAGKKKSLPKVIIHDEAQLIKWLEKHGHYHCIRISKSILKTELESLAGVLKDSPWVTFKEGGKMEFYISTHGLDEQVQNLLKEPEDEYQRRISDSLPEGERRALPDKRDDQPRGEGGRGGEGEA